MAVHREEGSFSVRVELSAEFGEEYDGDDDGNVWLERWRATVQPRLTRAIFEQLRSEPGFSAVPVSRGKNPEDALEIHVQFVPSRSRRG
ncbi:MAG TPA: hypothetical protein VII82_02130 [Polyangiaceae bacterium]|jgi:hypothetical protein